MRVGILTKGLEPLALFLVQAAAVAVRAWPFTSIVSVVCLWSDVCWDSVGGGSRGDSLVNGARVGPLQGACDALRHSFGDSFGCPKALSLLRPRDVGDGSGRATSPSTPMGLKDQRDKINALVAALGKSVQVRAFKIGIVLEDTRGVCEDLLGDVLTEC